LAPLIAVLLYGGSTGVSSLFVVDISELSEALHIFGGFRGAKPIAVLGAVSVRR
jgi:hypothetical protein